MNMIALSSTRIYIRPAFRPEWICRPEIPLSTIAIFHRAGFKTLLDLHQSSFEELRHRAGSNATPQQLLSHLQLILSKNRGFLARATAPEFTTIPDDVAPAVPRLEATPLQFTVNLHLFRRLDEFDLSVRTRTCLESIGAVYVFDLSKRQEAELLAEPNFGEKSLNELKCLLARMGPRFGHQAEAWIEQELRLWPEFFNLEMGLLRKEWNSGLDSELDRNFRGLEAELLALMPSDERDSQIAIRYLGWDGHGGTTLEAIGDDFGISRERVRQIVNTALERLQRFRRHLRTPYLDEAIDLITTRVPCSAERLERLLIAKKVVREAFRLEGVTTAAEIDRFGYAVCTKVRFRRNLPHHRSSSSQTCRTVGCSNYSRN